MSVPLKTIRKTLSREQAPIKRDIIGGLFPRGYVSIVASKSGVGKTWLALRLTCDFSTGGSILDGLVTNAAPQRVLFFAGETGQELLNERYSMTDWQAEEDNIAIYSQFDFIAAGRPINLADTISRQTVQTIVEEEIPDVIFIDTLLSFHSADENASKDVAMIMNFLQFLAKKYACAVVVMHHMRKASSGKQTLTQDEVIGSSALNRLAGVIFMIDRKDDNFQENIVVNVKNWNETVPPFSYRIINSGGRVSLPINLMVEPNRAIRYRLQTFIQAMDYERKYTAADISSALHLNNSMLRYYLDEFVNTGVLFRGEILSSKGVKMYEYERMK